MDESLIDALRVAVTANPEQVSLRLHLARLLHKAGDRERADEAVAVVAAVLAVDPRNTDARQLLAMLLAPSDVEVPTPMSGPASAPIDASETSVPGPMQPERDEFDWHAAEFDLSPVSTRDDRFDIERPATRLADVGGMREVKQRIEAAFLAPLRNPELRALYGKSLRGGLLLYGPPGCGKTFLAKALAGELDAGFLSIGIADVLDKWVGASERNLRAAFDAARAAAPCVLFIDELDAIGQRRSQTRGSGLRGVVNELLQEMDGIGAENEGVFVLAATNQPWDVDPALRRPGRLDRTLLVLPPDLEAREAILRDRIAARPAEAIDTRRLANATEGFSGADLAHVVESAAEIALLDSVRTGTARPISVRDLDTAVRAITPSTGPWLESARTVLEFGEDDGTHADLKRYLAQRKRSRR
ncbi:ATP-binding protein [Amnibacterium sp. CER49]|uniref:ATP-binding protein n=1 Tax=Amnibacterium sp. CER49 TaxID=3039161 RepID=UPI00244B84CC|nr:ATP-binding protein [Amnibacterium sp. CER49]MDH2443775.1 ATP-binding protein [Amnibacterium sp. CER49]